MLIHGFVLVKTWLLIASDTAFYAIIWVKLCASWPRRPVTGQSLVYRNAPKFLDRYDWAPLGAVCSGSTLFAIPSASFGRITLQKSNLVLNFRVTPAIFSGVQFF